MEEILALLVIVLAVVAILAFVEVQRLTKRVNVISTNIKQLRQQLDILSRKSVNDLPAKVRVSARAPVVSSAVSVAADKQQVADTSRVVNEPTVAAEAADPWSSPERTAALKDMPYETPQWQLTLLAHFKENWLVWCGGLAMVFGLGYLVQFITSHFNTAPSVRIGAAIVVSLLTIGAGEWLHRKFNQGIPVTGKLGKDYIPAAIVAAGTTGVYASLVFATVTYHLIGPMLAMVCIAATALLSLFAALRYGSLMAVLGLIGGYIAPLWLSSTSPAYFVLGSYVTAISAVGLYVLQRCRLLWLLWGVVAGHVLWVLLISFSMASPLWWIAVFYPLTAYLLVNVPDRGWRFTGVGICCRGYYSFYVPVFLGLMLLALSQLNLLPESLLAHVIQLLLLALLMWQSLLLNNKLAYQTAGIAAFLSVVFINSAYSVSANTLPSLLLQNALWWLAATGAGMLALRQQHNRWNYWWLIAGPQLVIAFLLIYTDQQWPQQLWLSSLLSVGVMALLAWFAFKSQSLRAEFAGSIHGLVLLNILLWIDGPLLSLLLSLQVLVATWQIVKQKPMMHSVVPKALVSILIILLTLFPFVSNWHVSDFWPTWSLALVGCLPALAVLFWARSFAKQHHWSFVDWLEGCLIHITAVFLFIETHYLVTGSYDVWRHVDLTGVSFWLIEALVLSAIYRYRKQLSEHALLQRLYDGYCQLLLGVAALCLAIINLDFMPLWSDSVTGAAWPLFNGLTLGWLIPAVLILALIYRRWLPIPKPMTAEQFTHVGYGISGVLLTFWGLLSIRQFWQPGSLQWSVGTTSAEWLTYSVTLIVAGCLLTFGGVRVQQVLLQKVGLGILGVAALKVFLSDIGHLDGVWRVVSFLGLGAALIGIGRLFQVLKRKQAQLAGED